MSCNDCPLNNTRCGTRGNPEAQVVFVGEAPLPLEIRNRSAFTGPGATLLRDGVPPGFVLDDQAYFINAVQCFVVGSKDPGKIAKAIRECKVHVTEMIAAHPRKVIIPLGRWASESVLNTSDFKITQHRGQIYEMDHPGRPGERVKVAPIYHPAFLMRGSGNLKQWRSDIVRALDLLSTNNLAPKYIPPLCLVATCKEHLEWMADELHERADRTIRETGKRKLSACDTETTGFDFKRDQLLCISIYPEVNPDNEGWVIPADLLKDPECLELVNWMMAAHVEWVYHNGKFDYKFLHHNGVTFARIDHDTILMSYALDETQGGHDLESLSKDLLGAPSWKWMVQKYLTKRSDSYAKVPKPVLYDYASKDVKNTVGITRRLYPQIQNDANLNKLYHTILLPTTPMLARTEMRGIMTDAAFVEENKAALEEELILAEAHLKEVVGYYVNPNSPQQVQELLFDKLNLRIKGKRPTSTDKSILDKLSHPAVDAIKKYRRIGKMLSTYVLSVIKFRDEHGVVHTTFTLTKTSTGRLSSREPNIQNIPREARYRRMYCARPGKVLIEADYNTAELRMLAALSGDVFLTEVFLDDKRNLHDEVSVAMYGADFTPDQRIRAKAINFGIPYGREAFSIAQEFEIPNAEAQRLIDAWFERAPEAAKFIKKCRMAPMMGQTLINAYGRKRRPGVVSEERIHGLQNEFANFFMQSTVADMCNRAAVLMEPELDRIGSGIVNLVHDSIVTECDDNPHSIAVTKEIMQRHMEAASIGWVQTDIIFKVDFKVGTHWGLLGKG